MDLAIDTGVVAWLDPAGTVRISPGVAASIAFWMSATLQEATGVADWAGEANRTSKKRIVYNRFMGLLLDFGCVGAAVDSLNDRIWRQLLAIERLQD